MTRGLRATSAAAETHGDRHATLQAAGRGGRAPEIDRTMTPQLAAIGCGPERPGYQRRAASVNAPLIAESMTGAAVASLMGCDGFSASTVTT